MDFWTQYSNELARAAAWGTIFAVLAVVLYFGGKWYIHYRKKHAIVAAKEKAGVAKDVVVEKGKQAVNMTVDTAKSVADTAKPVIGTATERARTTAAIAKERFDRWRQRKSDEPAKKD
jgi:hypothetical protein